MEGDDAGRTAADGNAGVGVRADDEDGFDLGLVERQEGAIVFEQDGGLACGVKGGGVIFGVSREMDVSVCELNLGSAWIMVWKSVRAGVPASAPGRSSQPNSSTVVRMWRILSSMVASVTVPDLMAGSRLALVHELAGGHFEVEAAVGCADAVVGGVPVGHDGVRVVPLIAERSRC